MDRLKYLACFAITIASALGTYRAFTLFQADAVFTASVPFVNTVVLLLIWALSFSAKNGFVRRNKFILILIPMMAIQGSNLVTHLNNSATSQTGFLLYLTASTSLVFFSYWTSIYESRIG